VSPPPRPGIRERIAQSFPLVEDAVYLALALLLAAGAIALVGHTARVFGRVLAEGTLSLARSSCSTGCCSS
jgi:hypothetical protein